MSSVLANSAMVTCSDLSSMADLLRAANINPHTGLATDYLNHFNEVAMLLELLPSMPEAMDDVLAWEVLGYKEHFEHSGFREKKLVAEAYDLAPARYRKEFDDTVAMLNERVRAAQTAIVNLDLAEAEHDIMALVEDIRTLIARAGAIVNGGLAPVEEHPGETTQDAIDALFD